MIKREFIARPDAPCIAPFYHRAVDTRPDWQFFDVADDPECLNDLADSPGSSGIFAEYRAQLIETLTETGDPRVHGYGDAWEDYPRIQGRMRNFPRPDAEDENE